MPEIMISIRPEWTRWIVSGKKTVEVRKTRPKIEVPFLCYIYQCLPKSGNRNERDGRVIGEFICDKIDEIDVIDDEFMTYIQVNQKASMFVTQETCLDIDGLQQYLGNKSGFGWHISDLIVYDKPKELNEFVKPCNCKCFDPCPYYRGKEYECDRPAITRPPQSWCYCERVSK